METTGGENKQGSQDRTQQQQQPPAQKCPRCESVNTKFCYYNNYSLTQPRYFCKTCRRYWTQGGTLRNVPVGGGCRKGKRAKTSSSASSTSSSSASPSPSSSSSLLSISSSGRQLLGSSNLSHQPPPPPQYMISPVPSPAPVPSYYQGAAGFLNSLATVPNHSLIGSSSAQSSLGMMQGFGGFPFPATSQFFNPRQEENLMMGFPGSSHHQLTNWQRSSEEKYEVGGGRSVPETAVWSISTSTTVEGVHAPSGKRERTDGSGGEGGGGEGGGGSCLNRQSDNDRRWNHGGGGGGGLPGYGPS